MSKYETALLLYPNQLFEIEHLPNVDIVYIVEEPLFFGTDREYPMALHKQKLVLHRASMRRYVEEYLWPNNINVEYIELHNIAQTGDVVTIAKKAGVEHLVVFDPVDFEIDKRLSEAVDNLVEAPFELKIMPNPNFMLKKTEILEYFTDENHFFADFYQWQRERFNILIDKKYKPVGGKWSFDAENRKKLPIGHLAPGFESYGGNDYVKEATKWVEKRFPGNPGQTDNFIWPTNHDEAQRWLKQFIKDRLEDFGPYEDAIDGQSMLLYHSGISPVLNIGLLNPDVVIKTVMQSHDKKTIPLASLEGFVRQIVGWREYVRAIYVVNGVTMRNANQFSHQNSLSEAWWDGSLGVQPIDDVITKVNQNAYAHHIERLMIIGNFMMLCQINPHEVYKWFMSLFIDAYDWVMVPNVYGMSQFSDLGSMVTKPYISGSNYILKMSHYAKDDWCDIWDGLFWSFIERNEEFLKQNRRTVMMVKNYHRLNADRKRIISYRAKDFMDSIT